MLVCSVKLFLVLFLGFIVERFIASFLDTFSCYHKICGGVLDLDKMFILCFRGIVSSKI